MNLTLLRLEELGAETLGVMFVEKRVECFTLEPPWRGNEPGRSCVPTGLYLVKPSFYHRGGYRAFELQNVPGRERVLIHIGNTTNDTTGCILVGTRPGTLYGLRAVLESKAAFKRLTEKLQGLDDFTLTIRRLADVTEHTPMALAWHAYHQIRIQDG